MLEVIIRPLPINSMSWQRKQYFVYRFDFTARALLRQNLRRAAHRPAASAPVAAQAASDGSLDTACIICRISMAAGIDAKVPCRSTASAATRCAQPIAGSNGAACESIAASTPQNTSPAPDVSTATTGNAGRCTAWSARTSNAPRAPRVTTTHSGPAPAASAPLARARQCRRCRESRPRWRSPPCNARAPTYPASTTAPR